MATQIETTLQQFLTDATTGPFAALYLPLTDRFDREKAKLELKHQIDHAKSVMATAWPASDWAPYDDELMALLNDPQLLEGASGQGLGVLTNGTHTYVRELEYAVSPMAMVTATPQVLPIILDDQRHLDFDLLLLQSDQIALYHNAGDVLTPVALPADAPVTLKETLGTELRGGSVNSVTQGKGRVSYHGHNEKAAEDEVDQRRYFQAVDQYVATHYSKPGEMRLVLFGLPQNIALFRDVSRNSHLSGSLQIDLSPSNLSEAEVDAAVDVVRAHYAAASQARLSRLIDEAKGRRHYRDELGAIITAVTTRAVATLIIRQGARLNGRLLDGVIDQASPVAQHNNLLNDLADLTIAQGGQVRVATSETLTEPVAAVLRYEVAV